MAQPVDSVGRYPQSTPDGDAIPFEIVRPAGCIKVAIQAAAINGTVIPDINSFLVFHASAACYVVLNGNAAALVANTYTPDVIFIAADEVVVIDHNGATTFGVIRAEAVDGTLHVEVCKKYVDVRKSVQLERM